jgi:hypothetical protein
VTFAEDGSTIHTGAAPSAIATFRNLAIGTLKAPRSRKHRLGHRRTTGAGRLPAVNGVVDLLA